MERLKKEWSTGARKMNKMWSPGMAGIESCRKEEIMSWNQFKLTKVGPSYPKAKVKSFLYP
jgi:hypothetical protein